MKVKKFFIFQLMDKELGPKLFGVFKTYIWPSKNLLFVGLLFMALFALLEAASVKILEPIVDEGFIEKNKDMLYVLAVQVILLFLAKGASSYVQSICMTKVGLVMVKRMQDDLFRKLVRQDVSFFSQHNSSSILVYFMGDMGTIREAVLNGFTSLIKDGLTVVFMIGLMFWKSYEMAAVMFVLFPIGVYPVVYLGKKAKNYFGRQQVSSGALFGLISQAFQAIKIVKAYQLEEREVADVVRTSGEIVDLSFKMARTSNIASPIMELLGGIAMSGTLAFGGWRISQGSLSAGEFVVFLVAIIAAYKPMKNLANLNIRVQVGVAAIDRVAGIMDHPITIAEAPDATELKVDRGEIVFDDVTFGYVPGKQAIRNVSLRLPPASMTAVVGLAGAGKSTLTNLVQRFYDVEGGRVMIDGQDIRSVTLESLHKNIAFVSQDVILFDGTIFDNIRLGRPAASEAEVIEAAKRCGADDFIVKQAQGYQTQVGERGGNLSGGQKQLVSIARAMLKNAPILLLDEPTSSLDSRSERMVQDGLKALIKGRSSMIIAHRLSTIRDADIIYVMEEGRVIESGGHAALLAQNGRYAQLYRLQHGEPEASAPRAEA